MGLDNYFLSIIPQFSPYFHLSLTLIVFSSPLQCPLCVRPVSRFITCSIQPIPRPPASSLSWTSASTCCLPSVFLVTSAFLWVTDTQLSWVSPHKLQTFLCSFTSFIPSKWVLVVYMSSSFCISSFFPSPGFLVETVQSNPQLLMESSGAASYRCQEITVNETSIPVPVLNWQTSQLHTDSVYILLFVTLSVIFKWNSGLLFT